MRNRPNINWDQLEEHVIITCKLRPSPRKDVYGNEIYNQSASVQRLRPLIGYAFDPDNDQTFSITGAAVAVEDSQSTYYFEDQGDGRYLWDSADLIITSGNRYRLEVVLPDSRKVHSEIIMPELYLKYDPDTLWISPDSITVWSHEQWVIEPVEVEGPHFKHIIKYGVTPGAILAEPIGLERYVDNITEHLWYKIETTDSTISIYTATDSMALFRSDFTPVRFIMHYRVDHKALQDLYYIRWDDEWPVENLEDVSNVEGAYGIFTAARYRLEREYVVALKP